MFTLCVRSDLHNIEEEGHGAGIKEKLSARLGSEVLVLVPRCGGYE